MGGDIQEVYGRSEQAQWFMAGQSEPWGFRAGQSEPKWFRTGLPLELRGFRAGFQSSEDLAWLHRPG